MQYHPGCIQLNRSEREIKLMTSFKCPICENSGQEMALYDPEGIIHNYIEISAMIKL